MELLSRLLCGVIAWLVAERTRLHICVGTIEHHAAVDAAIMRLGLHPRYFVDGISKPIHRLKLAELRKS